MLWLALATTYVIFWLWYSGVRGPLTPQEVENLVASFEQSPLSQVDSGLPERVRRFAESDDGESLLVVNLVEGGEESVPAQMRRRQPSGMLFECLSRACHPVFMADFVFNFLAEEDSPEWSLVGVVRYRSRRDFLEATSSTTFLTHASRTPGEQPPDGRAIKFVTEPRITLFAGPRFIVLVFLVALGVFVQSRMRRKVDPPGSPASEQP